MAARAFPREPVSRPSQAHRATSPPMPPGRKVPKKTAMKFTRTRSRKGGRGAAGKVAVFGVLERGGKVFTVAVPDCKKETLMAKIEASTVKGSVYYTDEFSSYNDLARLGKHVPIDHGEVFADGEAHINGIEGFWSYAKRLHRLCHGVDRENFPLYLAEYEFRYNHRAEHLPSILFKALILPQLQEEGLA